MLDPATGRRKREAPLARINNREELGAWLRKQPREVAVAFAARAALRTLPILQGARGRGFKGDFSGIILPVFRATGVAWATAKYPVQPTKFEAYAYAAHEAAHTAFADTADTVIAVRNYLATVYATATAAAAAAFAPDAACAAATAAVGAAYAAAAFEHAFWSAVSIDATRVEGGAAASDIAGLPLWPQGQPDRLRSLWQGMKARLHAENQDWQVWTLWFDDRVDGQVRDEELELAYVRIDDYLWEQGPAAVNSEIKRRIEPKPDSKVSATKSGISGSSRPVFKGFFSYNHDDAKVDPHIVQAFSSELEKRVDAKLVNAGFEIWRDKEELQVGDYWDPSIKGAIDSSHIFIVLLTPKWISSDYCRKEFEAFEKIEAARNSGGYVIPIYARDIEKQARFLEAEQKELLDRLKRIQYQQVIPKQFARLSDHERIELIEGVADPICDMLYRLRDKPET